MGGGHVMHVTCQAPDNPRTLLAKPKWNENLAKAARTPSPSTHHASPPTPHQQMHRKQTLHSRAMNQATTPTAQLATTDNDRRITIAVIGDVHNQWDDDDEAILAGLNADVAVFVGDFGNEDTALVQQIAAVSQPRHKVVMLGNHDAWYSLTPRGRQRALRVAMLSSTSSPQNIEAGRRIRSMLEALGTDHIGLAARDFPGLGVAFVGGRPFSKGGPRWSDMSEFYSEYYGIGSMEESAHRILDVLLSQHPERAVIVVAHNGPTGLGEERHSLCGVDWMEPAHDFGDPDLEEALEIASMQGRTASLVLFGHMHHTLKGGGFRDMAHVNAATGTVYLNAAVVPRWRKFQTSEHGDTVIKGHHFLMVDMVGRRVESARHVWAALPAQHEENDAGSQKAVIVSEQGVIKTSVAGDGSDAMVVSYYKAQLNEWTPVVVKTSHECFL